jgi:hypothetical protein
VLPSAVPTKLTRDGVPALSIVVFVALDVAAGVFDCDIRLIEEVNDGSYASSRAATISAVIVSGWHIRLGRGMGTSSKSLTARVVWE